MHGLTCLYLLNTVKKNNLCLDFNIYDVFCASQADLLDGAIFVLFL